MMNTYTEFFTVGDFAVRGSAINLVEFKDLRKAPIGPCDPPVDLAKPWRVTIDIEAYEIEDDMTPLEATRFRHWLNTGLVEDGWTIRTSPDGQGGVKFDAKFESSTGTASTLTQEKSWTKAETEQAAYVEALKLVRTCSRAARMALCTAVADAFALDVLDEMDKLSPEQLKFHYSVYREMLIIILDDRRLTLGIRQRAESMLHRIEG